MLKLNSVTEVTTDANGNVTNYLSTDSALYQNLVDAFDYWNDTLRYPQFWVDYKGGGDQQIEVDVWVEDHGVFNNLIPNNAGSALHEGTLARGTFVGASGPKVNNNFVFANTFPENGWVRINRKYIDSGYFNEIKGNHSALYYTIRHELAHVLGFNSVLLDTSIIPDAPVVTYTEDGVDKYYYTGTHGLEAYKNAISDESVRNNIVGIPLEDNYGENSAGGHFEEGDESDAPRFISGFYHPPLNTETMTPVDDEGDLLSSITLGVFKDKGYVVDTSKAEPFTIDINSHRLSGGLSQLSKVVYNDAVVDVISVDISSHTISLDTTGHGVADVTIPFSVADAFCGASLGLCYDSLFR